MAQNQTARDVRGIELLILVGIAKILDVVSTLENYGHGVSESNRLVELVAIELGFGRFGLPDPFTWALVVVGIAVVVLVVVGIEFAALVAERRELDARLVRVAGYVPISAIWVAAALSNYGLLRF